MTQNKNLILCENCGKACNTCDNKNTCNHHNSNKKPVYFNGWVVGYRDTDMSLRQGE